MRPYSACVSRGLICSVTSKLEYYVKCYRSHRRYELASPIAEVDRLGEKEEKLRSERLALEAKVLRLRKQERMLRKKMRELGNREEQNILDLEMDEALAEAFNPELPCSSPAPGVSPGPAGFFQVSFDSLSRTSPVRASSS